jgi:hypothetical protein
MQSVYEAAGGSAGLLRLAEAWHCRVMADEMVSHAFSHGFHPQHAERLAAYWAEALGGPRHILRQVRRRDLGRADPQGSRAANTAEKRTCHTIRGRNGHFRAGPQCINIQPVRLHVKPTSGLRRRLHREGPWLTRRHPA